MGQTFPDESAGRLLALEKKAELPCAPLWLSEVSAGMTGVLVLGMFVSNLLMSLELIVMLGLRRPPSVVLLVLAALKELLMAAAAVVYGFALLRASASFWLS